MEGKSVSASAMVDKILEFSSAEFGFGKPLLSGRLMYAIDHIAAIVAKKHAGAHCVTLGIDSVRFFHPVTIGDTLRCQASVNRAWNTSMEVGVEVFGENFRTLESRRILSAYFTFVALDEEETPIAIPNVIPETAEELRRFEKAGERRALRLAGKAC